MQQHNGHLTPPALADRGAHSDAPARQATRQVAGRLAVGLPQLRAVYAVEPHGHTLTVRPAQAEAVAIMHGQDGQGIAVREARPHDRSGGQHYYGYSQKKGDWTFHAAMIAARWHEGNQ